MGMMEDAAAWLNQKRLEVLSVPVMYVRRDGCGARVNATLGRTIFRAVDAYGVTVRTESQDFLVSSAELPTEPCSGDFVLHDGCRYEVLAPNGEPVWSWSGTGRLVRRIHTKQTGEAEDVG